MVSLMSVHSTEMHGTVRVHTSVYLLLILNHDPSIGGSIMLQIVLLLAETHNNMIMMADNNDNIHADRTCNNNNSQHE